MFLIILCTLFSMCTDNPVKIDPNTNTVFVDPTFNVTGKILTTDGNPIYGARATLKKYGLTAISDSQGVYTISGKITAPKALAKTMADTIQNDTLSDTVVVKVSLGTDSLIITEKPVQSGIVMELPTDYIVQRNISGELTPDDMDRVGKVVAVVYDKEFPEIKKEIKLWHDKVNQMFNSFAYFSTDTGKEYVLYVDIYDTNNIFVGRSVNYNFTNETGDIDFKSPIIFNNGTPKIKLSCNFTAIYILEILYHFLLQHMTRSA